MMSDRVKFMLAPAFVASIAMFAVSVRAQSNVQPVNELHNPYTTFENWAKMPEGRTWGATSAVEIDRDGKSIWVAERCGANTCVGSKLPAVFKFDVSGKLLKSFGKGCSYSRTASMWIGRVTFG